MKDDKNNSHGLGYVLMPLILYTGFLLYASINKTCSSPANVQAENMSNILARTKTLDNYVLDDSSSVIQYTLKNK